MNAGLLYLLRKRPVRAWRSLRRKFRGVRGVLTLLAIVAFLALFSLSSLAFPGTNSFVGELLVLMGTFQENKLLGMLAIPGAFCFCRSASDFFSASRMNDMLRFPRQRPLERRGRSSGASSELMMICVFCPARPSASSRCRRWKAMTCSSSSAS